MSIDVYLCVSALTVAHSAPTDSLVSLVPTLPGWEQVWFLSDASSPSDINATLAGPALKKTVRLSSH